MSTASLSENKRIWVVGVGGIGGVIGYRLSRAGLAPLLFDGWPEHVAAINRSGLVLEGQFCNEPVPVRAIRLDEMNLTRPTPDLVFLCVKSYQTKAFLEAFAPCLDENSTVVSLQNGMNEELLADQLGSSRIVGAVVMMDGNLVAPGVARQENPEERNFVLGTLDGQRTRRIDVATEVLEVVGKTRVSSNIWGELWSKLVHNCLINAVCALTNRNASWALREDTVWRTAQSLASEAVRVALAHKIVLEPAALLGCEPKEYLDLGMNSRLRQAFLAAYPATENLYPSMQQDVRKGRKTEIEFLNGWIVRKGKEVGVPTPLSAAVTGLIHRVEGGVLKPGPEIVEIFLYLLSTAAKETEQQN